MRVSIKKLKYFSVFFFLITYTVFYMYKVAIYNLFYYQHDMFSVLCASRDWIFGHPLLWDNRYGFTPAVHFSFIAPLLSPFTILSGGKGLFIAHSLIYFISFCWAIHDEADIKIFKKKLALLFVFLISPYAFWLFDDTNYGWHLELLFLPFSLFFALALISAKRGLVFAFGLLTVLTKEDGSVIACCIHLLFVLSQNIEQRIDWKKIFKIVAGWFAVFIFSLLIIKLFNDFKTTRLEFTLSDFFYDHSLFNAGYFRKITWQFIVMLLPLSVFCFIVLGNRNFLRLLLCTMPVVITGIVSGLWYSGNEWFSLAWVPRFVCIMGVMLAGTFIYLHRNNSGIEASGQKLPLTILIIITMIIQGFSLAVVRDYKLFNEIKKAYMHSLPENVEPNDSFVMKCIAEETPQNFNVAVPYQYFSLFDKNDLTWFDHPENAPQKNPDLVILEDSILFSKYNFDYDLYNIERKNKFYVFVRKDKKLSLRNCN